MLEKSHILIIDPSPGSRMKIKAVTSAFMRVERMAQALAINHALQAIADNDPFDLVFISSSFAAAQISSFVHEAKQTAKGGKAAFVLIVGIKEQESTYIVNSIIQGLDGFVLEPLSVDTFMEVVKSSREKVKDGPLELDGARKKKLLEFLLGDAIHQIDISAAKLSVGQNPGYAMQDLKETTTKISAMIEDLDEYGDLAAECFGRVPAPEAIKNKIKRSRAKEDQVAATPTQSQTRGYFIRKR